MHTIFIFILKKNCWVCSSLYLACFYYYSPNKASTLKKIAVGKYKRNSFILTSLNWFGSGLVVMQILECPSASIRIQIWTLIQEAKSCLKVKKIHAKLIYYSIWCDKWILNLIKVVQVPSWTIQNVKKIVHCTLIWRYIVVVSLVAVYSYISMASEVTANIGLLGRGQ